jgi:hypothetical protein
VFCSYRSTPKLFDKKEHIMPLLTEQTGKKLVETLTDPDGKVLYSADHEVASDNTITTTSEQWHDDVLQQTNEQLLKGESLELGSGSTAVEAAKLAWDIIKEGKAVGKTADAKSAILSTADMDPLNYEGAREGKSGTYTWKVNDKVKVFGEINYVTIKLRVEGKYGAKPVKESKAPEGHYLPDVYVNVTHCTVNFPCSASGTANLSNPSNIGRGAVNAEVKVHAKLTAGWFAQHFGISIGFQATGTGGFRLLGRE